MKGKMREGRKRGEDEKWSRQLEGKKAKLKRNGETEWKQHFHFLLKNKAGTSLEKIPYRKKSYNSCVSQ